MTDPSRVRVFGALQRFAPDFATELARQGYAPRSVVYQIHLMAHVSRWLTQEGLDVSDLAKHADVCGLRSFLRFLHVEGAITQPLAAAVPAVAGWRLAGLPKGLGDAQVRRLLTSFR